MNNNNNDNTKKEYIRKFIHVHLIHVRSTRIEHIIQAVNDQSNIPTNTERSALFNHIGMWYPSPNPKNSARVSVKIYLLDTTGTDRLYICILSSYCANVESVESDCSATGGEIDVRTVFLLFFFPLSLFAFVPVFIRDFLRVELLGLFPVSHNSAIVAFIDEERVQRRNHAESVRRQIPFPRLQRLTWLISHTFRISRSFARPTINSYTLCTSVDSRNGERDKRKNPKRKQKRHWNFKINHFFVLCFLSASFPLCIYLFIFYYFVFFCICYKLKNLGGGLHAPTPSVKKQCWNVISWRGQPLLLPQNKKKKKRKGKEI